MPMFLSEALDALLQFQQALDTSRSSGWLGSSPSGGGSYPPLNVFRQGDDIVVIAEVPGVCKSDLADRGEGANHPDRRREVGRLRRKDQHPPPRAARRQL